MVSLFFIAFSNSKNNATLAFLIHFNSFVNSIQKINKMSVTFSFLIRLEGNRYGQC
jgi:hypothetical protein